MARMDEDGDPRYPADESSIDASDYIANWPSKDGIWATIEAAEGIPYPKLGKLAAMAAGGLGLAVSYFIIGPIRQLGINIGDGIEASRGFWQSIGDQITNVPIGHYQSASGAAQQAVGSEGIVGFGLAFGLTLAMALILLFLRRGVTRLW